MAHILIEGSKTPIYRRIIEGLCDAAVALGHDARIIVQGEESAYDYVQGLNGADADLVIVTNLFGPLSEFDQVHGRYGFESLTLPVAFMHYDNVLGPVNDWNEARRRYNALLGASGRSRHFCLKQSNLSDFDKLMPGLAHPVSHATEFSPVDSKGQFRYDLSFVGHALPEYLFLDTANEGNPLVKRAVEEYGRRARQLDYCLEPGAVGFANQAMGAEVPVIDWLAAKQLYRAYLNSTSLYLRGNLLSAVADEFNLDLVGGDPAYLNNRSRVNQLEHPRIRLHEPDRNHAGTDRIYAESRININITSIQFDAAIVNRVLDVAAVGGFLLTDWKENLKEITSVHEQISYRTVDELKEKIEYYLQHESERHAIAEQLQRDVIGRNGYRLPVTRVMEVMSGLETGS